MSCKFKIKSNFLFQNVIIADELVAQNDKCAAFPQNNRAAKYKRNILIMLKNEPTAHKLFTAGEC